MIENEVWKDVKDYEGLYQVSDRGNVRSVERRDSIGRKVGGRIMKPIPNANGYIKVNLYKNGIRETKYIHRLVLEAFVENPSNFPEVNHLDEVKDNNELSNLEWCDARYNNNYGTRIERFVQARSKKVKAVNIKTGEIIRFKSTMEAGRKGYNQGNVAAACRGDYNNGSGKLVGDGYTYRGYRWSYEEVDDENSKDNQ